MIEMLTIRRSNERGHANRGWLDAYHSFSFNTYHDPDNMGFGPLRVINEDKFGPSQGFGMHPHENMEIITYVLSGSLAHEDNTGGKGILRPGDIQRMSAGTGVFHSEANASDTEWLHLFQIWIEPNILGAAPRYGESHIPESAKRGKWAVVASGTGREGAMEIYQDAELLTTLLEPGESREHTLATGRLGYVHIVAGEVTVNGQLLATGDAAKLEQETLVSLQAHAASEVLLFDLPVD
jgi:redox-sensitive bicupin YhaK (pirin superfamily)